MTTATDWFDQFSLWAKAAEKDPLGQWCTRHWAPAPCFGADGLGAAAEVLQAFADKHAELGDKAAQLNRKMAEIAPICCDLGDEVMFRIWGRNPPPGVRSRTKHQGGMRRHVFPEAN